LNYGTSEAATIQLAISFDNCIQSPLGNGVGAPVGRSYGALSTGIGQTGILAAFNI
jgi:hypothetical protein